MFPAVSVQDISDGLNGHPKPSCEFSSRHVLAQDANLANLDFGQLCPAMAFAARRQAGAMGVAYISGGGDPLQVAEAVVGLEAVDVISLFLLGGWSGEGRKDEAVNKEPRGPAFTVKVNTAITMTDVSWFENVARPSVGGPPNVPHVAEIRDFVETFVAKDGLPGFKGGCARLRVHRKVLLSVPRGRTAPTVAATLIIPRTAPEE